jgi:gliding motility-associated-like protein
VRNNANDYTYTYASANSFTASLRVTTDSGCVSALNTQTIKVNPLPVVDFSIPQICLPDGRGQFTSSTTISDGSTALLSYRWNFNDPNDASSSTLPNPIHRFSAVGPYPIQLIVRSNNNCVDSSTKIISSIYPQPKANFSASDTIICINDAIQFTDLSDGKTSAISTWVWDFSAGNTASIQNPSQLFRDSGLVQVSLHIVNAQGCVSDTAFKTITVYPYPKLDLGPDLKVLQNGQASLKPLYVYGTGLSYLWTPSTYLDSDTAAIPNSKPLVDITYQLALTNLGGCTVKDEIFIEVLKAPQVPNAFSPNGDGVNDTWRIPYLDTYPGATVDVFNRYGQKVFSSLGYATEWTGKLNGKALPVGTYYYVINPKNGLEIMNGSVTIVY